MTKENFTTGVTLFLPMQIGAFSRQTKKTQPWGEGGVTLKNKNKKNKAPSHGNRPAICI